MIAISGTALRTWHVDVKLRSFGGTSYQGMGLGKIIASNCYYR